MSDKKFTTHGNEPIEARIVAWVLGEASAFEADELERLCEEQPELAVFKRRIEAVHGLVEQAHDRSDDARWKLSNKKRAAIEELIGAQEQAAADLARDQRAGRSGRRALLAIAACLMLTLVVATLTWPIVFERSKSQIMSHAADSNSFIQLEDPFGNTDSPDEVKVQEQSSSPSSSVSKVMTTAAVADVSIAVPSMDTAKGPSELSANSSDFGSSGDFGSGWGTGFGESSGEKGFQSIPTASQKKSLVERKLRAGSVAAVMGSAQVNDEQSSDAIAGLDSDRANLNYYAAPSARSAPSLPPPARWVDSSSGLQINQRLTEIDGLAVQENLPMSERERGKVRITAKKVDQLNREELEFGPVQYGKSTAAANALEPFAAGGVGASNDMAPVDESKRMLMQPALVEVSEIDLASRTKQLAKSDYMRAAYDHTRSELLRQVESAREIAVPEEGDLKKMLVEELDEDQLRDAVRQQENKVEERRKALAQIVRTKENIFRGNEAFFNARPTDEDRSARYALEAYHMIEQEKLQLESQIASLLKYDSDQLMVYAAGLDLPDNTIRMLYPEYLKEQRNIESLLSNGHDKNHPTVVAATDRLSKLKEQLDGGVVALRATLQAQNEFVSERLKKVEAVKDASKQEAIKRGLYAQDYVDAKREFETEQERLQLLKLRLIAETISSKNEDKHKERKRPIPTGDEMIAAEEPYSTFSLNISDASYRVAQAALAKGEMPDPEGIKVEQFYNAVDYGDPAPATGQPVTSKIEQTAHPLIPGRNLVRIAIKTASQGRSQDQPLRLTLLIDQSGSMSREDRRVAMVEALEGLRGLLKEHDQVNLIGFARTPRLIGEAIKGNQGQLGKLVNIEANEGGTNLEQALKLGEQLAQRHHLDGAQNRIVLFTDGAANLGDADPGSLADKIKDLRQKGISFDIAGIVADGLNDELLGEMARHGNGRYYVVGKGEKDRFAEQLAGAFRPAAENVKVQVHFNAERVGRYKLIGFEKERLNQEDFRNDAVDAAEMAAEEAGVAIYQVETLPEGDGEIGEVSVRFRDVASDQMVERSWTIANQIATPAIDQAQPSMQLATLAMLAGEKLRGGPLAEAINFNEMGEVIAQINQHFKGDPKAAEMLEMLEQLK